MERIELPNREECLNNLRKKNNYKRFGISEADTIKQKEMKEKEERSTLDEQ